MSPGAVRTSLSSNSQLKLISSYNAFENDALFLNGKLVDNSGQFVVFDWTIKYSLLASFGVDVTR